MKRLLKQSALVLGALALCSAGIISASNRYRQYKAGQYVQSPQRPAGAPIAPAPAQVAPAQMAPAPIAPAAAQMAPAAGRSAAELITTYMSLGRKIIANTRRQERVHSQGLLLADIVRQLVELNANDESNQLMNEWNAKKAELRPAPAAEAEEEGREPAGDAAALELRANAILGGSCDAAKTAEFNNIIEQLDKLGKNTRGLKNRMIKKKCTGFRLPGVRLPGAGGVAAGGAGAPAAEEPVVGGGAGGGIPDAPPLGAGDIPEAPPL